MIQSFRPSGRGSPPKTKCRSCRAGRSLSPDASACRTHPTKRDAPTASLAIPPSAVRTKTGHVSLHAAFNIGASTIAKCASTRALVIRKHVSVSFATALAVPRSTERPACFVDPARRTGFDGLGPHEPARHDAAVNAELAPLGLPKPKQKQNDTQTILLLRLRPSAAARRGIVAAMRTSTSARQPRRVGPAHLDDPKGLPVGSEKARSAPTEALVAVVLSSPSRGRYRLRGPSTDGAGSMRSRRIFLPMKSLDMALPMRAALLTSCERSSKDLSSVIRNDGRQWRSTTTGSLRAEALDHALRRMSIDSAGHRFVRRMRDGGAARIPGPKSAIHPHVAADGKLWRHRVNRRRAGLREKDRGEFESRSGRRSSFIWRWSRTVPTRSPAVRLRPGLASPRHVQFIPDSANANGLAVGPLVACGRPDPATYRHLWKLATRARRLHQDIYPPTRSLLPAGDGAYNWGEICHSDLARGRPSERAQLLEGTRAAPRAGPARDYNYGCLLWPSAVSEQTDVCFPFAAAVLHRHT